MSADPAERRWLAWVTQAGLFGVAAASALTVAVAIALTFFAHPMGDDFCNGADARDMGLLAAVWDEYTGWGGRWSAHTVVVGFPTLVDYTRFYAVGLLAVMAVSVLAARFLVGSLPPLGERPRLAWTLALGLVVLHWSGMPHPGQSVYWFEGAATYSLNVWGALVVVGGLLRLPPESSARRHAATAALALLSVLVGAAHELFALVLLGALCAGFGVCWLWRDPRRTAWGLCIAACAAGLASVMLAPGNAVRTETFPQGQSVPRALVATVAMWWRVVDTPVLHGAYAGPYSPFGWILDVKLLAATVLFATSSRIHALRPAWLARDPRLWRVALPLLTLAILTGAFLAGGWALGRTLPLRAFNGLYVIFLLGWFLTVFVHTRWDASAERHPGTPLLRAASAVLLALGLLLSTNLKHGVRDLATGRLVALDREMQSRYAEARQLREAGGTLLEVSPVAPWPSSYFEHDVDALQPPIRACMERFLGVEEVRMVGPLRR